MIRVRIFFVIVGWFFLMASYAVPHKPLDFLKKIHGLPDEGQQIVRHYCSMCHDPNPQVHLGAPRIGYSSDWARRLKQGLDKLLLHTQEGLRAMPPRGGCFECTDAQLQKAIKVMTQPIDKQLP